MRWLGEWIEDDALNLGRNSVLIILIVFLVSLAATFIIGDIRPSANPGGLGIALLIYFSGLLALGGGFREFRKFQRIKNLPTSKIRSVPMGLAELKGSAKAVQDTFIAPISGKECVFYETTVEQKIRQEHSTNYAWEIIFSERPRSFFVLEDDTGRIPVEAGRADLKFEPEIHDSVGVIEDMPENIRNFVERSGLKEEIASNKDFGIDTGIRFREKIIEDDENCYALGRIRNNDRKESFLLGFPKVMDKRRSDIFIVAKNAEENLTKSTKKKALKMSLVGITISLTSYAAILGMAGLF